MWSSGDAIVLRYRSVDGHFRAGRPLTVVILAVVRQPGDPVEPYAAHATGKRVRRLTQQGGVVRPAPERT